MLKNYLTITLRNIRRHKGYAFINLVGLGIGMACCILILLYIQNELSFDRFNKNHKQIYRIILKKKASAGIITDISTPPSLAVTLKNDFPQIVHYVRFFNADNPTPVVRSEVNQFYEKLFLFTDPEIFDIFSIPFIHGNPNTALKAPNAVVLTESTARKYFGKENPIGKTLVFNNSITMEVTGVVQNFPQNSTIKFDFLASFSTLYNWLGKDFVDNHQNSMCQTYILISQNVSLKSISFQMSGLINKYFGNESHVLNIYFQPLDRIHLYSNKEYNLLSDGDINNIILISAIAFFILIIACFNYINLTIIQFIHRFKEVGIRKLVGATRKQMVWQFLGEGLFLSSISLLLAIVLVIFAIPYFNTILSKSISINNIQNLKLIVAPVGIVLFVSFLSSCYPAYFLSSFQPIYSLKGNLSLATNKAIIRKILIVIQFSLTTILIIGTLSIYKQVSFMQNKRLGFDGDKVLVVPIHNEEYRQNPGFYKDQLFQQSDVLFVGAASLLPGGPVGKTQYYKENNSGVGTISMLWVDKDFIKTVGIKFVAGHDFLENFTNDSTESFIINEEAVRQLGWKSPHDAIGKSFSLLDNKKGTVIGVVKDFHFTSLQHKIDPIVVRIWPWMNYLLVRVNTDHISSVITRLQSIYHESDPNNPFEFFILGDNFIHFYRSITQIEIICSCFTLLAIMIACLGLVGLAAYTAEQRTKEIGIRKVLGASIYSILVMQLKEFIILILTAEIIAVPISYYIMSKWIENFAYRIEIGYSIVILGGLITFIFALSTISYHSLKAAYNNPTRNLRYE